MTNNPKFDELFDEAEQLQLSAMIEKPSKPNAEVVEEITGDDTKSC